MKNLKEAAFLHISQARFREALPIFLELSAKDPADWNSLYLAGQCYRFTGKLDLAVECLKKAVSLSQQEAVVFQALGIALQLQQEYRAAIESFRKALELDPDNLESLNSLAVTQRMMGQYEKAEHNYVLALEKLAAQIVRSLENRPNNPVYDHGESKHDLFVEYALKAIVTRSVEEGVTEISWPTGEMALREAQTREHQGLFWVDRVAGNGKNRLFLPNCFSTYYYVLANHYGRIYSSLIGNLGTVLEMTDRKDEARKHFEEAEEFMAWAQQNLENRQNNTS